MSKLKIFTFDDLVFTPHTVVPSGKKAYMEFPNGTNVSVIRGGSGLYGFSDGDTTFEVWFSDEDEPRRWVSREEINEEFASRSLRWDGLL